MIKPKRIKTIEERRKEREQAEQSKAEESKAEERIQKKKVKVAKSRCKHLHYGGVSYGMLQDALVQKIKNRKDVAFYPELYQETYLMMIEKELLLKISRGDESIWNKIIGKKRFTAREAFVLTCKKKRSMDTWIIWHDDYLQAGKEFEASKNAEGPVRGIWYSPKQLEKTLYNEGYGDVTIEYRETEYMGLRYKKVRLLAAYHRQKKQTVLTQPPVSWIADGLNKGVNKPQIISRAKDKREELMVYVTINKDDIRLKMASANDIKAMENAAARAVSQSSKRDDIIAATKARFGIGAGR